MSQVAQKFVVILVVAGFIIGSGLGYYLAPQKVEVETKTVTVTKSPLADTTQRLGFICSDTSRTEYEFVIMEDMITPDINEYLKTLGFDMEVEILIDDAQGQIATHLEKVQAFKSIDVNLLVAGEWSSQAEGALSYVNENDMFMLSPSSTSPILSIADDNLYRLCPNDFAGAPVVVDTLWSWGIEAVVILQRGDAWADGLVNVIEKEYPKKGGVIVEKIRYATEVKEYSSYLDSLNSILEDEIEIYGVEHVGVLFFALSEAATIVSQTVDYPILQSVIWMGTEDIGRRVRVIDDAGEAAIPLRCFGTLMSPAASWKWDRHVERYDQHTGMIAGFYTAILEDCAWTMLKSVLETDSMDATDIIEVFPDVSSSYYGTTGWCDIDEYGDRKPSIYEIWGYALVDGEPSFMKFGEADAPTHTVAWDLDALQSQGLTPPGH